MEPAADELGGRAVGHPHGFGTTAARGDERAMARLSGWRQSEGVTAVAPPVFAIGTGALAHRLGSRMTRGDVTGRCPIGGHRAGQRTVTVNALAPVHRGPSVMSPPVLAGPEGHPTTIGIVRGRGTPSAPSNSEGRGEGTSGTLAPTKSPRGSGTESGAARLSYRSLSISREMISMASSSASTT